MTTPTGGDPVLTIAHPTAAQIWAGSGNSLPVLVANLSTTATVYVGYSNSINPAGANVVPIGPQQAFAFDGSRTLYGVALANTPILLLPGATQYFSGNVSISNSNLNVTITGGTVTATVTGSVSIVGTPTVNIAGTPTVTISGTSNVLITNANVSVLPASIGPFTQIYGQGTINGASAFTVATSTTSTPVNLVDVSIYATYDLAFAGFVATQSTIGAALTQPIVLQWFDDNTSGIPVYQEEWWVWVASSLGALGTAVPNVWGTGKMHGRYMSVSVSNFGNSLLTVQYLHVYGSPRDSTYSNWRQNGNAMAMGSSGVTMQQSLGQGYDNRLGELNGFAMGASSTIWVPLSLFSGPFTIRSNANVAFSNPLVLCHAAQLKSGGITVGTSNAGILWNAGVATGDQINDGLYAPRAPMFLVAASGATGPSWTFLVTAKEAQ